MNASDSARRRAAPRSGHGVRRDRCAPVDVRVGMRAQIPAVKFDVRAAKGLLVSPVYEGWYEVDGTKYALFGYSNRNLEEIVDIPIGPHNHVAPGPADQGQPTRFFPGMYYGVVRCRPAEGSADRPR